MAKWSSRGVKLKYIQALDVTENIQPSIDAHHMQTVLSIIAWA